MPRALPPLLLALSLVALSACDKAPRFTEAEPGEALSGGQTTVFKDTRNAFSLPSNNLTPVRRLDFAVGNSFFRNPWVIAPSTTTARDGLGPLMNTNACQNCHIKDGRGHPPVGEDINAVSMLVRISRPASAGADTTQMLERIGVVPDPVYGTQLQDMSIPGVAPEARIRVNYTTQQIRFKDGTPLELRTPHLQISNWGYGEISPDTLYSTRIAPPMIGLGLLEAIPEEAILANAKAQKAANNGIAGQPNYVWDDALEKTVLGRFGLKAGQPTLNQQNVHAFSADMGLTTSLRPFDECTEAQTACKTAINGGVPEVSDHLLAQVLFYTRNLGVPARRKVNDPQVLDGKGLFHQAGCQQCHTPQYTTAANAAEPELANQIIRPYTDLLLHDMGPGLADNRPEFKASGSQWRTPALWGIGLTQTVNGHTQFLHDGRARNLLEAIAWHGGEAEAAKQQVLAYDADQRAALLAFLNSL